MKPLLPAQNHFSENKTRPVFVCCNVDVCCFASRNFHLKNVLAVRPRRFPRSQEGYGVPQVEKIGIFGRLKSLNKEMDPMKYTLEY